MWSHKGTFLFKGFYIKPPPTPIGRIPLNTGVQKKKGLFGKGYGLLGANTCSRNIKTNEFFNLYIEVVSVFGHSVHKLTIIRRVI